MASDASTVTVARMDQAFVQWLMGDEYGLEDTSPDVPAWYADAACADYDTERWFPGKGRHGNDAVAVCDECPVREQCLDHALELEDGCSYTHRSGIWGGLTARQRAALPSIVGPVVDRP